MSSDNLGKLENMDLREEWEDEEKDFTPWIAENIDRIEELLGMSLEIKGTEKNIGSFKADIIAEGPRGEKEVIIENQLERSNHKHLGQLITYGSGVDAFTVIWICKELRDEHRRAINWLNQSTREDANFLALEIDLYKIGNSKPAPKLDVVVEPNEWSQNVSKLTESFSDSEEFNLEFWTEFKSRLEQKKNPYSLRNPSKKNRYMVAIGRSNFKIYCKISQKREELSVELYFDPQNSEKYLERLKTDKEQIESELGRDLEWKNFENKQACIIRKSKEGVKVNNKENWENQFDWLEENLNDFYQVFRQRVRDLEVKK